MNLTELKKIAEETIDIYTVARFFSKVVVLKKKQCWEWKGYVSPNGYGLFSYKNIPRSAHSMSYIIHNGIYDKSLWIDHMCMNRKCVNPTHLRLVTPQISCTENTNGAARKNKDKKECPHGHPYDGFNLKMKKKPDGSYQRRCRICINKHNKEHMRKARQTLKELWEL